MDLARFWWSDQAAGPGGINNSLRFRGAQHLSRLFGADCQDATRATISVWVKRGGLGGTNHQPILSGFDGIAFAADLVLRTSDALAFRGGGDSNTNIRSDALFRDPASWYHVVAKYDTTQGTSSERQKLYVNGVQQPVTGSQPDQNTHHLYANSTQATNIGAYITYATGFLDGYLAEFNFVDGQALDPTSFGEFDANGVWIPTAYAGTYGANGFYLDFSDPADIGADRSGNGNNFTPSGFELANTAAMEYDWMQDSPTQNYPTLNPLDTRASNISFYWYGNLTAASGATVPNTAIVYSTVPIPGQGKWAVEFYTANMQGTASLKESIGVSSGTVSLFPGEAGNNSAGIIVSNPNTNSNVVGFVNNVQTVLTGTHPGNNTWCTLLIDASVSGQVTLQFRHNNVTFGGSITLAKDWSELDVVMSGEAYGPAISFGNHGTGSRSSLPQGYEYINTQTQPAVTITDPSDHFQAITDTGANILTTAQATFPDGLWWIKDRANTNQHQLVDSIYGTTSCKTSPSQVIQAYSEPSGNSVAWCWNAGGAAVANGNGSLASQVSANTAAGFSLISYTGNGVAGATVGHGLTETPELIITTCKETTTWWSVYHKDVGPTRALALSQDLAAVTGNDYWDNTAPNSTVFTVGFDEASNGISKQMVAYCWHSVPGYSAFGSYEGVSDADGPFIYTGFRPAFMLIKRTNGESQWVIVDSTRDPVNPTTRFLRPNQAEPEDQLGTGVVNFMSNGIKFADNWGENWSQTGGTYIYAAFAENPFGGNNVAPANAR